MAAMHQSLFAVLLMLCAGAIASPAQGLPPKIASLGINKIAFEVPRFAQAGGSYVTSEELSGNYLARTTTRTATFTSQVGSDIFVIDGQHATPQKLVSGGMYPAWSPDGSELAYCTWDGEQIEVINADGTGRRRLTNMKGGACFPDWSPDGTKIAFTSLPPGDKEKSLLSYGYMAAKNVEIYVVDQNGGDPVPVTEGYSAHWSPGGSLMILLRRSETKGIDDSVWLATPDGKQTKMVGASDRSIDGTAWLPSGKGIVSSYMHDGRHSIFRSYLDGSQPRGAPPKEVGGDTHTDWSDPAISPDEKHLMAIVLGCAPDNNGHTPSPAICYSRRIVSLDLETNKQETLAGGTNFSVVWEKK